jgi:hypothetical protein
MVLSGVREIKGGRYLTGIRTEELINTSLERHRFNNLLGKQW